MIFLRVITRKDDEQIGHGFTQRDVVILNTVHHCHPELVSGSQKLRRFRNMSWIIGRSAGSTQPSLGRVSLSLHSYQNPQFGMTINKIPPHRNQRFRSSRNGWTFCAISLLCTPSAIRHAVSRGSYFAGSTSVPN